MKKTKYHIFKIVVLISLISSLILLLFNIFTFVSLGIRAWYIDGFLRELFSNLLGFIIAIGLYKNKRWSYYPALFVNALGIFISLFYPKLFYPNLLSFERFLFVGVTALYIWLIYSCRDILVS